MDDPRAHGAVRKAEALHHPGAIVLDQHVGAQHQRLGLFAVLASIIKQPYPNSAHRGYDPNYNLPAAKERWEYTMKNMLETSNWPITKKK